MTLLGLFWHLAGLLAPALALAPAMVLLDRLLRRRQRPRVRWPWQLGLNLLVCSGVLVLGLVLSGEDGRLATYAALVAASAACQSWLGRSSISA